MSNRLVWGACALFLSLACLAQAAPQEYLVRFNNLDSATEATFVRNNGGQLELVSREGMLYKWTSEHSWGPTWDANVAYVERNHPVHIFQNPTIEAHRAEFLAALSKVKKANEDEGYLKDNPEIQDPPIQASGADPMLEQCWGLGTIGAETAWKNTEQGKDIIVAVTDTGVDYNHEDLIANMWRNKDEIPNNNIDDDKNGFVDDIVGWDFASNDNKPYDLSVGLFEILLKGGNPGHGTHVSGVVGARLNNSVGVAGVAPQVKIMAMRFITENGQGTTANAIKAIDYAVANGANVINASWGGEAGDEDDKPLREAIQRAGKKNVIFVAAAGNGRVDQAKGAAVGYDNDSDKKPVVPASYNYDNMVAVSAVDSKDNLAAFSNWGHKSVKLGAPGVKILSTVPGNRYQDTIIDIGQLKATWDGTSMAAPFVSGALAVVWSQNKEKTAGEVIETLISLTKSVEGLKGKVSSEGRLHVSEIK